MLEGERRLALASRSERESLRAAAITQRVLEPLFYEALARTDARSVRRSGGRPGIPFLNGGLFERHYGDVSLPLLDDVLFSTEAGLLGFLDRWTFTVAEEAADESEVAVDPEVLGRRSSRT